ncbi:TIGR03086 family metal-binding protein [Corynebacterium freiburgense]|uniref:TIGR03086 family metal-binding protein n=1 Tax=Corynebacterium freiburgense TaxID=556548 RepID=UPI0003FFD60F|nr:TIGR03086 family metal-binding protein [Corynebacterium freiburgense]WJZ02606.1 hypothetical protein CFREI_06600 [Corynebacterium freiburgense]
MEDFRKELLEAFTWIEHLTANTPNEMFNLPTPCTQFSVEDLLTHFIQVGEVITKLPVIGRHPHESVSNDPAGFEKLLHSFNQQFIENTSAEQRALSWRKVADNAQLVWDDPAMQRQYTMPWGIVYSGKEIVGLYLFELVCHGFDLAKATNQPVEIPNPHVAEAALKAAKELVHEEYRGIDQGVPFEYATEAPDGAGPTVRLAAFLGREV